jgi:hypothetical protein
MKRAIEKIVGRKLRLQSVEGVATEVHGDGTATVEYRGRTRRLVNVSGRSLVAGQRVMVDQLEGYPEQAFISGLSPKVSYDTKDVWI